MRSVFKFLFSPTFLLCLYVICVFTPIMYSFYLAVPMGIGFLFVVLTFRKFIALKSPLLYSIIALVAISLLYWALGYSTASYGNFASRISIIYAIWAGFYLWNYTTPGYRMIVLVVLFASLVVNLIYAIEIRILIPELNTSYLHESNVKDMYGMLNIGGTEYTYCAMYVSLFLFIYLFITKPRTLRYNLFLYVVFFLCVIYVLVFGESATASLSFLVSVIALLLWRRGSNMTVLLCMLTCTLFLFTLVILDEKDIIEWITEIAGDKTGQRIQSLFNVSSGKLNQDDEEKLSRFPMILYGIQMWLSDINSFVVGWGFHTRGDSLSYGPQELLVMNKCGDHSTIIDVLPRYGIFGLIPMFFILRYYKRYVYQICKGIHRKVPIVIFIVVVFNNIMNKTTSPCILLVLFFLYPYLNNHLFQNKEKVIKTFY